MEIKNLSNVRRLALSAVIFNVLAIVTAAIALPHELSVLLPIVALVLPLLTLAGIESVAERRLGGGLGHFGHAV
ncbi:MAG: hypothetical protein RL701_4376 [Pseudomonadota bacterium]|jgi:hypothetical protein